MIDWKVPELSDMPDMRRAIEEAGVMGSDANAANIFLLREKYNIKIAFAAGALVRLYTGTRLEGRGGITFPLGGDTEKALELLEADCVEREKPARFIFLTDEQREIVAAHYPDMILDTTDGNSDYTYSAEHLSQLKGKENEKKRNRVSRFKREYPNMEIRFSDEDSDDMLTGALLADMTCVEEKWFALQEERPDSSFLERVEIYEACKHWEELGLLGAVIYVADVPVAMTIASRTSEGVYDIHFEKCYGDYAQAGGFAVINKLFAEHLVEKYGAKWINREEDIGLEGLRRAKMAYRPDKMLVKYHSVKQAK